MSSALEEANSQNNYHQRITVDFKMAKKASKPQPSISPLADRLLVEPIEDEMQGENSSIILPETMSKEKPEQGRVLKVGPGKRGDDGEVLPMSVKEGDRVIFTKFGPEDITVEGEEYLIVSESNVLATIG